MKTRKQIFFPSSQFRRKKIDRKSQIAGQIFIYILAIIIFAVIILFGYSAIKGFMEKGEQTAFIQFKNTLESEVFKISTEPGDIIVFNEKNPLAISGNFHTACFVDNNASVDDIPLWLNKKTRQIISSAVTSKLHTSSENVFLDPPSKSPIYIGYIETTPDIFCINITNARLDIRLEGLGYGTKIS